MAPGQDDVLRFDIPMDDPVVVSVLQGAVHFAGDLERDVEWKLLFPHESLPQ
jgi:hypoxanthine-guanine phosphoribosyltransferase